MDGVNYEIVDLPDERYGIAGHKAKFHYRAQAEAWVTAQAAKEKESYKNRKGHLQAAPNIYQEGLLSYPCDS